MQAVPRAVVQGIEVFLSSIEEVESDVDRRGESADRSCPHDSAMLLPSLYGLSFRSFTRFRATEGVGIEETDQIPTGRERHRK